MSAELLVTQAASRVDEGVAGDHQADATRRKPRVQPLQRRRRRPVRCCKALQVADLMKRFRKSRPLMTEGAKSRPSSSPLLGIDQLPDPTDKSRRRERLLHVVDPLGHRPALAITSRG